MSSKSVVRTGSRREQKARTRSAIREAALRCFAERGFSATGIADIAGAAGVAHGTFYVHYSGKEALLEEVLAEHNLRLAQQLEPLIEPAPGPSVDDVVRAAAEVFFDYWDRERAFARCYLERFAAGAHPDSLREGVNPPMVTLLRAALERTAAARSAPDRDWTLVAHGLLAMWLRLWLQYLFGGSVSRQSAIDTLVVMISGAVGAALGATR